MIPVSVSRDKPKARVGSRRWASCTSTDSMPTSSTGATTNSPSLARTTPSLPEAAGLLESKPSETKQYGYYKNISLSTEEYEYIKQYEKWDVAIDRAGLKKHLDINAFNDKFNSDFEACKHYLAVNREDSGAYLV